MAKNKKNYYAVARGLKPGLYKTWPQAEEQVKNYQGAKFKGFYDLDDALNYLSENGVRVEEHKNQVKKEEPKNHVLIYTDGSAIGNPGPGGYGAVISFQGKRKELSRGFEKTTNNRMELMACIAGLAELKTPQDVIIYSDSKYVVDGIEKGWALKWRQNGWKRHGSAVVENADLWRKLLAAINSHNITFVWVKGHAGKKENERCDQLANDAARGSDLFRDNGFNKSTNMSLF